MQILTVDVGTGTQDVLLFDSEREIENCFKLVLPSPTVVIADRIRAATAAGRRLVLHGVTMGGGPSHWATMDHVRAGLQAFATPEAARTFDDDLDAVANMGIQVVSDDEAMGLADAGAERVFLRDLALGQILQTLAAFGVHVHLVPILLDRGYAPTFAAALAGLVGAMQVLGRVLMTPLAGRVSLRTVSVLVLAVQPVALVVLLLVPGTVGVVLFVALFGAAKGCMTLVRPAFVAELYGLSLIHI